MHVCIHLYVICGRRSDGTILLQLLFSLLFASLASSFCPLSSLSLLFLHVRCLLAFNLPYLYSFPLSLSSYLSLLLSLFLLLLLPFFPCWPHNSLTWLPQTLSSAAFSSSFAHSFIYSSIRLQSSFLLAHSGNTTNFAM